MYRKYVKRPLDLVLSFSAFLVLFPLFIIITLLLSIANGGQPFFTQTRPGLKGRLFRVIKFRTMNTKTDDHGVLLPDEQRLTRIGKFVRKTSLDEIPQLLNVIKGDMSLIGPRPLLVEYLPLYSAQEATRHDVRPGITGWAQINGRNTITWQEKFQYDIYYVQHVTFLLDLKIFFLTILKVLKAEGISGRGVVTAEKFNGSN